MCVKILLVDDDYVDLEILKRHLRCDEFELLSAESGEKALSIIKENPSLSLVLLDAVMPSLSGFETCKKISKLNINLPVILVTGLTDDESLKHAFDSGAVDFIKKPIIKQELISRINNTLKIKSAEIEIKKLYSTLLSDLKIASSVQSYLIPGWINKKKQLTMSSLYIPQSSVSGDLFDMIQLNENKFLVYIGDISGHGVQASLIMAAIQMVVRSEISEHKEKLDIVHVLNELNIFFAEKFPESSYMTFLIGILDLIDNTFKYFSAGHPPVIISNKKSGKSITNTEKGSFPLGMFSEHKYCDADIDTLSLEKYFSILLCTDGLFECISDANEKFDLEKLLGVLSENKYESKYSMPYELLDLIDKKEFSFDDDVTLLHLFRNEIEKNILSYIIPGDLKEKELVMLGVYEDMLNVGMNEETACRIEILLNEHLNNIILHGFKEKIQADNMKIYLSISLVSNNVEIMTLDKGVEWNIVKMERRVNHSDDLYKTRGRGVDIINDISEKVSYKRIYSLNRSNFTLKI
ncbi:MAG: SpoIIE family protein phosphatase [bacterium]|nr:SpoIIE family protein phosphatase [bacterium]